MKNDKMLCKVVFFLCCKLIIVSSVEIKPKSDYASFPTGENGTCYKRVIYNDELAFKITKGLVKTEKNFQRPAVKSSNQWVTIIDCCEGYSRNNETGNCETQCNNGCFGGTCIGPDRCICEDGEPPESGICKPYCHWPCQENAYCFASDFCTCKFGYEELDGKCRPVCVNGCLNGYCVAPRDCRCRPGFSLNNETMGCEPICEKNCSLYGECLFPRKCSCNQGYVNPPHNEGSCVAYCPNTCVNGDCESPGICTCKKGYTQTANNSCVSICQTECENGYCESPERCICNPGYVMDVQSKKCLELVYGTESRANSESNRSNYNQNKITTARPYANGNNNYNFHQSDIDFSTSVSQQGNEAGVVSYETSSDKNYKIHDTQNFTDTLSIPSRGHVKLNQPSHNNRPFKTSTTYGEQGQFLNQQNENFNVHPANNSQNHRFREPTNPRDSYSSQISNNDDRNIHNNHKLQGPFAPLDSSPNNDYASRTNNDRNIYTTLRPLIDHQVPDPYDKRLDVKNPIGIANTNPVDINQPYVRYNQPSSSGNFDGNVYEQGQLLPFGVLLPYDVYEPRCNVPCYNGECIGQNICACKSGYSFDPNSPYSNVCVPICTGGCINGICSAPNMCLCRPGYVKEHGIKTSQRCVPIYQRYAQ